MLTPMSDEQNPTAAVLIIGNEILSGRTQDSNLSVIAKKLGAIGVRLREARVVADIEGEIVEAVNGLRSRYTYVITTGGIGPTHDDITAASIAKAFAVPLIEHPEARAALAAYYVTPDNLTEARLRMARTPQGASLIPNPVSSAPGFRVENVYVLAGVPAVMQAMMEAVASMLKHGPALQSLGVAGYVAESKIADGLAAIAARYPALDIGSYPWFRDGRYGTTLVTRGTDKAFVKAAADEIFALVAAAGGDPAYEVSPSAA